MKKFKNTLKKMTAFLSAVTLGISGLGLTASAEQSGVTIGYTWNSSVNPTLKNAKNGTSAGTSGAKLKAGEQIVRFQPSTTDEWAFCIEPGRSMQGTSYGDWLVQSGFTEYDTFDLSGEIEGETTAYWHSIKDDYEKYMGLVQYYGSGTHKKNGDYFAASQCLLWEMLLGYRGHIDNTFPKCSDVLYNDFTYPKNGWCTAEGTEAAYKDIVNKVTHHRDLPSNSALLKDSKMSKAKPAIMKYNTSTMRYEATVTVPTSYVTESSIAHNFSSLKSKLEKLTKDNFSGKYGTDYGVSSSVSGSNTVYTIWSKTRQFTSGTKTTEAVWLQTKGGISEQETLFAHQYYQTCLISTQIDPVSGYVSLAAYNEPNLTVEKTYYDANGNQITSAANLNSLLSNTSFTVSTSINGKKYYVVASLSGSAYVFSRYTENISEATKFKSQTTISGKGIFNVNDLPTAAAGGRTYTVSEIAVPTNYDKISQTVSLPSPNADDYSANPGTKTAKFANKTYSADYGDATIYKNVENSAENLSTEDLSSVYADTKFVAAYRDGNTVRYFTKAYKVPYQALPNPMDMTKLGLSVSDLPGYTAGDGQYYLPITVDDNHNVSFNTAFTSTNIADAYVFTPGYNYDAEAGSTCDYFGKVFLNFDTINVNNKKATSIYFVEIAHAKGYGYDLDSLSNTLPIPLNSIFAISNTAVSSGLLLAASNMSVSGNSIVANNVYPYAVSAVSGESRQAYGEINNERLHYNMKVTKTNTADEPISGAVFGLYKGSYSIEEEILSVKPIETAESDENGNVTFLSNLITGNEYSLYEISAPTGYVRDNTIYPVTLADTSSTNIFVNAKLPDETKNVENSYHDLIIEINKKDAINDIAISGIQFDISLNGTVVDTVTTDENGYAASAELELGKLNAATNNFENVYTVTEKADSDYHLIDENGNFIDSFEIVVSGNDIVNDTTRTITYSAAVNNYLETVDLSVHKVDNFDKPLKGVTFDIRPTADIKIKGNIIQKKGETVGTITTDENGYGSSTYVEYEEGSSQGYTKTITIYAGYEYELVETVTPEPYVKPENSTKFRADKKNNTLVVPLEVTVENETQKGEIKVYKVDAENSKKYLSGAEFALTCKDTVTVNGVEYAAGKTIATLTTDKNGYASAADLPVEHEYILTETKAPNGYVLSGDTSVVLSYNSELKYVENAVNIENKPTDVEISKTDITTGKLIDGAKLKITDKDDKTIDEWVSSVTEAHTLKGILLSGETYTLTETFAPDGYVISNSVKFTVSSDGKIDKVEMKDDITKVEVEKTDADTGKIIAGAVMQILDGETAVDEWTSTDAAHKIYGKLIAGKEYILHEVTPPAGYAYAKDIKFTVSTDGSIDKIVMSDKATEVHLSKKAITGDDELPGAKLQIRDGETVIEEWISTNEPHIIKGILTAGKEYILHEEIAPNGYVIANDITFTVNSDGTANVVTMEDDTTKIEFYKLDDKGNNLPGAKLRIVDSEGNVVKEWTSTAEAYRLEAELISGLEYTLQETEAPKGYVLSADVKFTVSKDGRIDKVEMVDRPTVVEFSKKSLTGAEEIPGAKLYIADETGEIIEKWTSTEKPHIVTALLEAGKKYILHEEVAPSGYVVASDVEFTVSTDGSVDVVTMYDDCTKVVISKKAITGDDELPGASLKILDGEIVIDSWVSTDKPHEILAKLVAGKTYVLHEEIAPAGYVVANDIEFTVSEDGTIDTVTMTDDTTKVEIAKYDADTGKVLSGAVLQILDGETVVEEWTSAEEPHVIEAKLIAGKEYILHEVSAPEHYLLSEDIPFTVSTDGRIDKIEINDLEQRGSVEIHKITEEMKNVEGIKFILSGTSNFGYEVSREETTDENGIALFEHLPVGTYTVTENGETVPTAYITADGFDVTVKYNETAVKEVYNEEKTGSVQVRKTTEGNFNVEGITFILTGVSDSGREISLPETTDENGIALWENIPVGTYTITEDGSTVPYGYLVADSQEVTVMYAETVEAEFINNEMTGEITVHKTTEGQFNVEGITFILSGISDTGREIKIPETTDKDGVARFENIPVGTYTITEDGKTVPYGYLVAEPQTVKVMYAETVNADFLNEEMTGEVVVHKTTEGMRNVEGITFILSGTSDTGREIKIPKITDKDGIARFENIPVGTYTITEDGKTVPYGYLVAEPKQVKVMYAETIDPEFINKEQTGTVKIQKRTEGMTDISGIKFILKGTSDTGREITIEATTDEKGAATFANVPIGTYTITEDGSTVPYGYLVADSQSVKVSNAETSNLTFENEKIPEQPETPSVPHIPSTPNTGARVGGTLSIVTLSAAIVIMLSKKRKRED